MDNPRLIYAMLMEKDIFTRFRTHPRLKFLVENLDKVGRFNDEKDSLMCFIDSYPLKLDYLFELFISSYLHSFMPGLLLWTMKIRTSHKFLI